MLGIDDHKKFVYNEMPDFGLSVLKNRFHTKNLEHQYKRYEQRILISKYYAARDWKKLYFSPPVQLIVLGIFLVNQQMFYLTGRIWDKRGRLIVFIRFFCSNYQSCFPLKKIVWIKNIFLLSIYLWELHLRRKNL